MFFKEFLLAWLINVVYMSVVAYLVVTIFAAVVLIMVIKADDIDTAYFKKEGIEISIHDFYHFLLFEDSGASKNDKLMAIFLFPSLAIYITYIRIQLRLKEGKK